MKRDIGSILWGVALILVGLGYAGNSFDIWNFNLFFEGWWTLFIIIPCLISILQNGANHRNLIGLCIGLLLLLSAQGAAIGVNILFPTILILIGISIIFRGKFRVKPTTMKVETASQADYTAIFGGQTLNFANEPFSGATFTAIFGGIDTDLRLAEITQDIVINTTSIFGGMEFKLPPNVKVKVSSTPIFGGVDCKATQSNDVDAPTIYFNAECIFGGLEIK